MAARSRCFLDIEIEDVPVGRLIIELYNEICPITCENFRALCTGEKGLGQVTNKPLWYKNTLFHRVVPKFVIQSGDFQHNNGTGGESIYGGTFPDENFKLSHDKPYLLSMANKGKNTNGSQFFITLQASPHLDKLHTVFGHIVSGQKVINMIENVKTDQTNKPLQEVKIAQCGELVLKSEKCKNDSSSESSSSSTEEEKKKRKKHKKEKKKRKKEKKAKGFYSTNKKAEEEFICNVDPNEIPDIPANIFLMRRTSPVTEFRSYSRNPRGRENSHLKRAPPSRTRSGRKVKGRGNMRYRTPSSSDERSGSETPPHWKQAQSRLKKLKEVVKEKEKHSDSEQSNDEKHESQYNPFLGSRLGSSRNFENERRLGKDARMSLNENRQRRDYGSQESRFNRHNESENYFGGLEDDQKRRRSWFDESNEELSDDERNCPLRSKIVAKSNVSKKDSRYNKRDDERESYKLGDERDNYKRGDERDNYKRGDERDNYKRGDERDNYKRGDERDNYKRGDERDNYKRGDERDNYKHGDERDNFKRGDERDNFKRGYERENNKRDYERDNYKNDYENSKRQDSSSDKRSKTLHHDSSSGHDNSYRKSSHHTENKKVTNETENKKIEKPKQMTKKTKKRLSMLENTLCRYVTVDVETEPLPNKRNMSMPTVRDDKNMKKNEEMVLANSLNSVHSDNLAVTLQECKTKTDEKTGQESNDNAQTKLCSQVSEKGQSEEPFSAINNVDKYESLQSDSSPMAKVVEYLENNTSVAKLSPNINEKENCLVSSEEINKELPSNEKNELLSNNFTCKENRNSETEEHTEKNNQKFKFTEKEQLIESEEKNDYNKPPEIISHPNEENVFINRTDESESIVAEERETNSQNIGANVQDAENSSIGSPKANRSNIQNKERKMKNEIKRKISPYRRSPSPMLEKRKREEKSYNRMSVSPRQSKSPDNKKTSKQSHSPNLRRSKSPVSRSKRSAAKRSNSRSRSQSKHRSSSGNRNRKKFSKSPERFVRLRRSRSRSHSRNIGRGSRSYRNAGGRNRSPEFRNSFKKRNKSPPYRGRIRGRSVSTHSHSRSRSHSIGKKRHRRRQKSSSSSSSSSSRSESVKRRNKKSSTKGRNKRSSSSSSSSSSTTSSRS